jgi:transposase
MIDVFQQVENNTARPIRYWSQDESRFGLKTITRRILAGLGIKPVGPVQWNFQYFYLYGAVDPLSGESFFFEFSHLNAECFQLFLDEFSKAYPHNLNVIQLDNGRFHSAKNLTIPDNIVFLFQPPYSPDVNPIERVWQSMKDKLCWINFKNLDELRKEVDSIIQLLIPEKVASLTGFDFILSALK